MLLQLWALIVGVLCVAVTNVCHRRSGAGGGFLVVNAFTLQPPQRPLRGRCKLNQATTPAETPDNDDTEIQWQLFQKYHARGSWKGIWTSYNYIGDVLDETIASVDLSNDDNNEVQQVHSIVMGAKRSDCETCFDSMEIKRLPVATYTPDTLGSRSRLGACGLVNGPSLLRSGAMATELVLSYGDGRVRVIFYHAPVWERGTDENSGPPDGLKLYRTLVSREALRDAPPTPQQEEAHPPSLDNPTFFRPVPPFDWHKQWAGTCWTWGPQAGNQGWALEALEEPDAWHGQAPVEVWNLRLPGGVFVQTPRIVTNEPSQSLCRLAWMPTTETLLRLEAGVLALQPITVADDDDYIGFYPPSLASFRCDVLSKMGDLEGQPQFLRDDDSSAGGSAPAADATGTAEPSEGAVAAARAVAAAASEAESSSPATAEATAARRQESPPPIDDDELKEARDALSL